MLSGCVLSSLVSFSAEAHLPEYFGRLFVLEVPAQDEPQERADCAKQDRENLRKQAEAEALRLEDQILENGAFNPGLADALGELAGLYASHCNHPAALRHFRDATQRLRISEGLLTKSQIPYLKAQARSSLAIGDSRSAQLTMRHVYRLQGLGRGTLSQREVDDSLAYFKFAREIYIDPRGRGNLELFFQAFRDNQEMLKAQQALDAPESQQLDAIAMSHLHNHYLLLGTDLAAVQGSSMTANAFSASVNSAQTLSYSQGIRLLEDMLQRRIQGRSSERAQTYFELGNWHMWNSKPESACASYASAWQSADSPEGESLRAQMRSPAELPEAGGLWRSLLAPELALRGRLKADFLVSARGDVSYVDASALDEDSGGPAFKVGRWLRDSHMRPAVVDGACVDGELRNRRYRLLD